MVVFIVIGSFCFLCMLALFAYAAGEKLRQRQAAEVENYVRERKALLSRLSARKQKESSRGRGKAGHGESGGSTPSQEDRELTRQLEFANEFARNNTEAAVSVVKSYIRGNPPDLTAKGTGKSGNRNGK